MKKEMKKKKMIPNALVLALLVALSVVHVAAALESADGGKVEVDDAYSSSTLPIYLRLILLVSYQV